ncbi:hypothetical protein BLA29_000742 [Euroglyphus maynei]|uniref:Uncharacterized protein n=1 Tax=Euroglyphus maynei TaxID=6958 RepID=A0A1Y3BCT9_EURMA|nr:hypothetical protein BLA29_000742 [Euroglyphus maynei]
MVSSDKAIGVVRAATTTTFPGEINVIDAKPRDRMMFRFRQDQAVAIIVVLRAHRWIDVVEIRWEDLVVVVVVMGLHALVIDRRCVEMIGSQCEDVVAHRAAAAVILDQCVVHR